MDALLQIWLLLLLGGSMTLGFLPSQESGRPGDYTHQSITEKGIYQAAATFIKKYVKSTPTVRYVSNNPVNITQTFFRGDRSLEAAFGTIVESIVLANNKAQKAYRTMALRTMNAEEIMPGHFLLQSIREQILKLAVAPKTDMGEVRKLIGDYLFTMQMFYSNTNWVETNGNTTCKALGIPGATMMSTAPPTVQTCVDCDYTHPEIDLRSCEGNIFVNGAYLTSGYLGYQNIPKPAGNASTGMGKCSHGGRFDSSQTQIATGGINKETSDPDISPHFFLHSAAGEAAVAASVHFLVGEVTGLLDQIGPGLFGDLIGIPVACQDCLQSGLSLAYVIDTSLSMSRNLKQIKSIIRDTVTAAMLVNATAPHDFILATFSDPVDLNTIRNTSKGEDILAWTQALTQKGGGDCPEYSFHALREALKIIRPGSCLFFYTDADPKDPELEQEVLDLALKKNVHIAFLLKGSCNTGIPFFERLENLTKSTCFKQQNPFGKRLKRDVAGKLEKDNELKNQAPFPARQDEEESNPRRLGLVFGVTGGVLVLAVVAFLITLMRSRREKDSSRPNNSVENT